jgi:protein associated with RNAse G/E
VEDKSKKENPQFKVHKPVTKKKRLLLGLFVAIIVLVLATFGYMLISKIINTAKDGSNGGKVLTVKDLENPNVQLTPDTSDASVENLTNGKKAKIDKQIAAKENPIDTVKETAGVLSNTTNQNRQDQLTIFLEDFLANHKDELWLEYKHTTPDQAQVNFWTSELYSYLVFNFRNIMGNKFTDASGKPIITTKEQLKYIDLYLALANDPKSHIVIPPEYKEYLSDYEYSYANDFSKIKNNINTGQYNG